MCNTNTNKGSRVYSEIKCARQMSTCETIDHLLTLRFKSYSRLSLVGVFALQRLLNKYLFYSCTCTCSYCTLFEWTSQLDARTRSSQVGALAFILMSVQIKSNKLIKLNTDHK